MRRKDNAIDIVFGIDDAYVLPLCVTLYSFLVHNTTFESIRVHILTDSIAEKSKDTILQLTRHFVNVEVDFVSVDSALFKNFPLNIRHITPIAYARFLIADIYPNLDKALYLDADLLVLGDLGELWFRDVRRYCLAGSHKAYITKQFPGYKQAIGLKASSTYINSGVMLMNLKRMRQKDRVRELLENAVRLRDTVRIQDQDIINITFQGEIARFDKAYNYTHSDRKQASILINSVRIVHFNTANKPWNNEAVFEGPHRRFVQKYHRILDEYRLLVAEPVA